MGIRRFQDLYLKKPCPHTGSTFRPNRTSRILIHPRFGVVTTLIDFFLIFYGLLQTFYLTITFTTWT